MSINSKGALLNYTTGIDAQKTAMEIIGQLVLHGCSRVQLIVSNAQVSGVTFGLNVGSDERGFKLPVNVDAVCTKLVQQANIRKIPQRFATKEQANRVAWRILKDWVVAQMAIVEAGMVKTEEVFLPYMLVSNEVTLFKAIEGKQLLLPAPEEVL